MSDVDEVMREVDVARGRAEERAAIVAYMRREAKEFAKAGAQLAATLDSRLRSKLSKQIMEVIGGAVEGLAGFFEDGGHLK